MPYGEKRDQLGDAPYTLENVWMGNSQLISTTLNGIHRQTYFRVRSGGRAVQNLGSYPKTKPPKIWAKRLVTVRQGPKTLFRYYDNKYKKWRPVRLPIKVWRLVRVFPPKRKPKKGMDLSPNALNFRENRSVGSFGSQSITGEYIGVPNSYRKYTGDMMYVPMIGPGASPSAFDPLLYQEYAISACTPDYSAAVSAATSKSISRLADRAKNQSLNLAQFLAERRQTAKLFADTVKRVAVAVRALKGGQVQRALRSLFPTTSKQLANDFLAWQFGVKPLISDLEGAAKHLAEGPPKIEFDIIAKSRVDFEPQYATENQLRPIPVKSTCASTGYVEVTHKFRVRCEIPALKNLSSLGFGNLASLAFELTPWSFVVDWAYPIGDYINKLDSFDGLTVLYGHKTVFSKKNSYITRDYGGYVDGYEYSGLSVSRSFVQTECSRSLMTSFPSVELPSLKDPLTTTHILDMLSLLRQMKR